MLLLLSKQSEIRCDPSQLYKPLMYTVIKFSNLRRLRYPKVHRLTGDIYVFAKIL